MRAKPTSIRWAPWLAPPGCKFYAPLTERGRASGIREYATPGSGTFAGSPTWQYGPAGPQLSGFTTSAGLEFNGLAPVMGTFPCWIAALVTAPAGASGVPFSQGRTANSLSYAYLFVDAAAPTVGYFIRGSTTTTVSPSAAINIADGRPHVLMGVSLSLGSHQLHLDGEQVGTSASPIAAFAAPGTGRVSVGYLGASSNTLAFGGAVLWAGMGNGPVPRARELSDDLLSGRFAAIRPRGRVAVAVAVATAPVGWKYFMDVEG